MAQTVALLGRGGQRFAESMLGWSRPTIRKGQIELESGMEFIDRFSDRGRKRAEHHLQDLLEDINAIVDLVFKAMIKIGSFSRGGKNRIEQNALDHDFEAEHKLVPFGIFLPEFGESHFWFSLGPVTADFMVDRVAELWSKLQKRFPGVESLVINADNGPESSGQRTQWLKRLVDFSDATGIRIELAYYPPYHSKYNPVERLWGVLENHWRGELLTSVEKVLGLARTMTYRRVVPATVKLVRKVYPKKVRLTKKQMTPIEKRLRRLQNLEKWFITITPEPETG